MQTFISKTLSDKLNQIHKEPMSLVIAPAGYGKTTAVHRALMEFSNNQQHWFTADKTYSPYENEMFDWFVSEIQEFNSVILEEIIQLQQFNRINRYQIQRLLKNITFEEPHFFIIDNLQYINDDFSTSFMKALAENPCANIHLIIISQYLSSQQLQLFHLYNPYIINEHNLLLTKDDLKECLKQLDYTISQEDINRFHKYTEGWIVMVSLCLDHMRNHNNIPDNTEIGRVHV